jgi:hypothetical protein
VADGGLHQIKVVFCIPTSRAEKPAELTRLKCRDEAEGASTTNCGMQGVAGHRKALTAGLLIVDGASKAVSPYIALAGSLELDDPPETCLPPLHAWSMS